MTLQRKLDALPNVDNLLNNLKEAQYQLAEKEQEIEKLKADFREQLAQKQEEITNLSGTI